MQRLDFTLTQEHIALCDLLKATGIAQSGGHGKQLVADGQVQVDGKRELRKACKIRGGQVVSMDGVRIAVFSASP